MKFKTVALLLTEMSNESPKTAATNISQNVTAAMAALKPFLDANPLSSIGEIERPDSTKILAIERPWGDRSLALVIPEDVETFASALNNLHLPARYSAVWHRDTKDLEILWTAFRVTGNAADVIGWPTIRPKMWSRLPEPFVISEMRCHTGGIRRRAPRLHQRLIIRHGYSHG